MTTITVKSGTAEDGIKCFSTTGEPVEDGEYEATLTPIGNGGYIYIAYIPVPEQNDIDVVLLNGGEGKEPKCVMGCKHFYGGEIKHHVDCPFYPDSLSSRLDECESAYKSASKEPLEVGEEKTPYELIADERKRKAGKYGYDNKAIIERTEDYGNGELSAAAACYCVPSLANEIFPWDLSYFKPTLDMPTKETRIVELVKAGAFIVDEIIRLQNK